MTRWARSGNTQKHKKMPEDSTPWEEFVAQRKNIVKNEKKFVGNKIKMISNGVAATSLKRKLKKRLKNTTLRNNQDESPLLTESDCNDISLKSNSMDTGPDSCGDVFDNELMNSEMHSQRNRKKKKFEFLSNEGEIKFLLKDKKFKNGKKKLNISDVEALVPSDDENFRTDQTRVKNEKHENRKKKKNKKSSVYEKDELESAEASKIAADSNEESFDRVAESIEVGPYVPKRFGNQRKNKSFFEKVKENRARNGILLLPKVVEDRLYRMKKSLRAKKLSGERIKTLVRQARRKAELEYRKTMKMCFNCRKMGHVLANCPEVAQDIEQGTGICFKCGSTEHMSARCHIKISEFPFAKCFICHNSGHLSRNCPENKHGIYPKGGKCNLCGDIYHLRKDCPKSSKKRNGEDAEITVHTINDLRSVDDEIHEMESKPVKQKKRKVVKF